MGDQPSEQQQAGGSDAAGRFAVPHVKDAWYVACESQELGQKPLARMILGQPLVLFREGSRAVALLDRCAHRNVPLSAGRTVDGLIECAYHGWRFDGGGVCRLVPALVGPQEGKARRVAAFPVKESQGFVWVWANSEREPSLGPYVVPRADDPQYVVVRYAGEFVSTLYNALENALDVPHTAFLHRGLFRGGKKNRITAVVRRFADYVEAEYVGEPRPSGIIGRLLAPGGGMVKHYDRFFLPSIAQVEYGLGKSHLLITDLLTPVDDFTTRMHAVVCLKLPVGNEVARRALTPLAKRVLAQDQRILAMQTELTRRFGGERFASTDVDVLGPQILRLLRQAERGEAPPVGESKTHEVQLLV